MLRRSRSLHREIFKSAALASKSVAQLYNCLFQMSCINGGPNKIQPPAFAGRTLNGTKPPKHIKSFILLLLLLLFPPLPTHMPGAVDLHHILAL